MPNTELQVIGDLEEEEEIIRRKMRLKQGFWVSDGEDSPTVPFIETHVCPY